ncbi:hypothetical protein Q4544_14675 [Cognatishimia sp. 1_MG-2023]|uniref:hypothetical protein n=1 Tax=Cognatishimia sp. 1_MG-2023 TaxID=3062642 RepID=UPI0026E1C523|nr:hypothetical protein [Cognatishimia sp. 1_MG-2023]MDO6728181.1 hypothetical protein [Cognatishimia sp. 1_MG-2023]
MFDKYLSRNRGSIDAYDKMLADCGNWFPSELKILWTEFDASYVIDNFIDLQNIDDILSHVIQLSEVISWCQENPDQSLQKIPIFESERGATVFLYRDLGKDPCGYFYVHTHSSKLAVKMGDNLNAVFSSLNSKPISLPEGAKVLSVWSDPNFDFSDYE